MKLILLDAGPLGLISNPNISPEAEASRAWAKARLAQGIQILIPEIADYEVRRELLRAGKTAGIARLDLLQQSFRYAPLTTAIMLKAAAFWAQARQMGETRCPQPAPGCGHDSFRAGRAFPRSRR